MRPVINYPGCIYYIRIIFHICKCVKNGIGISGESHPDDSGILYISLPKLAEENSIAGELAGFLLGKTTDPKSEEVKKIAERFKTGFSVFSEDKEVKMFLSLKERGVMEGRGTAADEFFELLAKGFTPEEAREKIKSEVYTEEKNITK